MNTAIAALQKSRTAGPAAPPPAPAGAADAAPEAAASPADVLIDKLAELEGKLDKVLKLLGANQQEESPEKDATEAPPNDDGY